MMRFSPLAAAALIVLTAPAQARKHHTTPWQHHLQELAYQNLATMLEANPSIMAAIEASNPALAAVIQSLAALEMTKSPTPPASTSPTASDPAAAPPPAVAPIAPPATVQPAAQAKPPVVTIPPTSTTPAVSFNAPGPSLSVSRPMVTTGTPPATSQPFIAATPSVGVPPSTSPPPGPGELAPFAQDNCPGETFSDNFQSGLGKWSFGGGGSLSDGNGAFASYQAPTQNATETTSNNGLNLSILPTQGANGAAWTAGLMNTQNTFKQTYGYWQATVDIPPSMEQSGMSWAFWMLGYNWPPEIDTGEFYAAQMDSAMHSATTSDAAAYYNYSFPPGKHVFATDWEPDKITWYVDGKQTMQANTPSDFNQPMFIVLGTAATNASQWTTAPQPGASATLTVEDVRVFNSMASALACVQNVAPSTPQVATFTPQTSLDVINTASFKTNSPLTSGGMQ